MKVWAVANQKGGVGKTTTAVTLAALLTEAGQGALLVDLDPHGSLSAYFGIDPESVEDGVYTLFQRGAGGRPAPLASLLRKTGLPGLTVMPASPALATLDRQLAGREGMGLVLARSLQQLAGQFDYALIDCPPVMGVLMVNALAASDRLLVPVQTEYLALKGLERMEHTLAMIAKAGRPGLEYLVVPTLYDQRTRAARHALMTLRQRFARRLWNGVVPVDTRFRDASRLGKPLPLVMPGARGVEAYRQLLADVLAGTGVGEPLRDSA